jgi:predicted membrane chloride channel (bestrophin family)
MARLLFILRVSAVVAVIIGAKLIAHYVFHWEPVSLNALFTGIIAANVFLMGFMLSGVLADYKESEKIPGELSACLDNMVQEVRGIGITNPKANTGPCLIALSQLGNDIYDWFYKKIDTSEMYDSLNELTVQFEALQPVTQSTYVARLKAEQSNLRRTLVRTETIRETNFIDSGYLLAEVITVSLCGALVLISMDPFYESLLFSGLIAFMLVFLLTLIRDLDNPFGYYERFSGADVTLKPFEDTIRRVARLAGTDCSGPEPVKAKATPNATA